MIETFKTAIQNFSFSLAEQWDRKLNANYLPYLRSFALSPLERYGGRNLYSCVVGNSYIKSLISSSNPCLVSRIGSTELTCVMNYLCNQRFGTRYSCRVRSNMKCLSGFFPGTDQMLDRYSVLFLEALKNVDYLGLWFNPGEDFVCTNYSRSAFLSFLESIEPYYFDEPWSIGLAGKTVLVVHPFATTILTQYNQARLHLFRNNEVLPEFQLKVFESVQSIASSNVRFNSWFEAYEYMCERLMMIDFDICLIGAGAYGLPLGHFLKAQKKKVIHLGGALQVLFGIKGRRWDQHMIGKRFYNDWWVRPNKTEIPIGAERVENRCYW